MHFDEGTGEKHIADVKASNGMVLELQNSPIPEHELLSREQFYRNMLWIVNGSKFKRNFTIFPFHLPPPGSTIANDLYIARPPFGGTGGNGAYYPPILAKRSDIEKQSGQGYVVVNSVVWGRGGVHDPSADLQKEIDQVQTGHYHFEWRNRREVWYRSATPVFIDFGDEHLVHLTRINSIYYGVLLVGKAAFIKAMGGTPPSSLSDQDS